MLALAHFGISLHNLRKESKPEERIYIYTVLPMPLKMNITSLYIVHHIDERQLQHWWKYHSWF